MPVSRQDGPYIWVTWLTKLLVGENSCEWSAWFKAQHEGWSWEKQPNTFDAVTWRMKHSAHVAANRLQWEDQGYVVFTEEQNSFVLRGRSAKLAGKPDLIVKKGDEALVVDVKTGRPVPSHSVQVMLYMYAVPRSLGQHKGVLFGGRVVYADHQIDIPASAVDSNFVSNVTDLILRLASDQPARRIPSARECRYCDITSKDCPERVDQEPAVEGVTSDF